LRRLGVVAEAMGADAVLHRGDALLGPAFRGEDFRGKICGGVVVGRAVVGNRGLAAVLRIVEQGCRLHNFQVGALSLGNMGGEADYALHMVETMHGVVGVPGSGLFEGGHIIYFEFLLHSTSL
jgi:hypothetical protein